jgi:hypothetical protein
MKRHRLVLSTAIVLAAALGLVTGAIADGPSSIPLETPDDPYVEVDSTSVRTQPAATAVRGPFSSIQVNVDRNGFNIIGDAANESSMAVDPTNPNRLTIGWRQFDTITSNFRQAGWGFSTDGGRSWTFPGVLERGVFRSDPVLGADNAGRFFYNSLRAQSSNFWCEVYTWEATGLSWREPVFAHGGDKQWMSVDRSGGIGDGNIYSHWTSYWGTTGDNAFNRSTDNGQTFDYPTVMTGSPYWGTTTVGPDGTVYVVGVAQSGPLPIVVAWSTTAEDPMNPLVMDGSSYLDLGGLPASFDPGSPNPEGLLGQLWIAADRSIGPNQGNIYIAGSVDPSGSDPLDVRFIRSTDGGQTWDPPITINDDPSGGNAWQWFGTMSVAPNGRIDVIWNDTRNDPSGYDSELHYSFSTDGGQTWSANVVLSPPFDPHLGWPNQNKMGDYYEMVSDRTGADVAWAATFNGEQDVYYLRIGDRDCNGNSIGDSTEIDTDHDGIIDDCDNCPATANARQTDSNNNGIGNACDSYVFGDGFEWGSDAAWNAVAP